ncbi:hypothetical protein [Wenjunlia tyrosinilytica]|uniref:hypothetical protein n=1 Tax=Wenjunlia tyrosinilytica TaxID=1544741 RepID=UPI00166BFB66|nr:hypothetical protein [Wenjunlia tyrosinilytica]
MTTAAYSVAGAALPLGVAGEIQGRTEHAVRGGVIGAAEVEAVRDMVARGEIGEMTGWASLWGAPSATVDSHTAKIYARVGDHAAAEAHYAGARKRYGSTAHQRIAALSAAAEGRAQLKQGQIEAACVTWGKALDTMTGIRSARARKSVQSMRSDLAPFRSRGARSALELDERARTWLREAV